MNRRRFVTTMCAGIGGVFVPRLPRWRADDVFVERWSWVMGQPVHVMVFASSEQEGLDACAAALAELRRVERRLTLFDAASDLCELNRRAFIDVSGDMGAVGAPPGEPGWLVEIADPDRTGVGRTLLATRLPDAALATAANTESIVRYGSLFVGHVMDPGTGQPARALQ